MKMSSLWDSPILKLIFNGLFDLWKIYSSISDKHFHFLKHYAHDLMKSYFRKSLILIIKVFWRQINLQR